MTRSQAPFIRDIAAALILIALGIVGIVETRAFPARAASWPMAMWGALIVFSLLLLLGAVRGLLRARAR